MFDILTVDFFFQFNLMGLNLITIICNHCLIISYSILIFFSGSYDLMLQCWQQKPNERPTFSVLKDTMADMLQNNNVCVIKNFSALFNNDKSIN